ncbi:MAG: YceI family protein [Actinomycetota bacterium]|nr:YceI family protein [Actinomycetota bacterium]
MLSPGTHRIGPDDGKLRVHTYREGVAQKVGHDLIIEVREWRATVEVKEDGTPGAISLEVDPSSLQVLEGHRGVKPLTDKDRADIRSNIDEKILRGRPISFTSNAVDHDDGRLAVRGELTIAGAPRPASFELSIGADGRVGGTLLVTQSEWGVKPYRAFMGALKVRDSVEVVLEAQLPPA